VFRLWLLRLFPFMDKWLNFAPACCGTCPTCATAGITGIALDLIASKPRDDSEADSYPGEAVHVQDGWNGGSGSSPATASPANSRQ
jgi:hypothetical protein